MIEHIAEGIVGIGGELRPIPGVYLPLRATAIRLADGGVFVHSPVRFDDAAAAAIEALGPVRHIVAPSGFHHLFAGHAAARWPEARLSVSPRVAAKRPDLKPHARLGEGEPTWDRGELDLVEFDGMPAIREFAFFHRPTGTVLLTDAVFNIRQEKGALSPLWFRLWGTHHRFAQSGLFRLGIRDKAAAARSARRILEWDIRRVIPCHGEVVTEGAAEGLAAAFERMMRAG